MTVLFCTFKKKKASRADLELTKSIEAQSGNENATIYNLNNNDMIIVNLAGFAWYNSKFTLYRSSQFYCRLTIAHLLYLW